MSLSVSSRLVDLFVAEKASECPELKSPQLEIIQLTLDTIPYLICVQDTRSAIRLVNGAFCEKLGLPTERIVGKEGNEFFIPNNSKTDFTVRRRIASKEATQEEDVMIDKAGRIRLLETLKVPLFDSRNSFQGTFSISRDITDQKRTSDDRELLISRLKDTVAVLEKQSKLLKKMNAQLKELAVTDDLTQVSNRRYFDHHFAIEWRRCCREQVPLALMIFDIDHFKRYNDFYGHTKGDLCLKAVAQTLNDHTCRRPGDIFARFGGEEFVGLLPNTIDGLESLAASCVQAIFELGIPHVKSSVEGQVVSVSIGAVVGFPHLLDNSLDLLDLADQQLYLAKQGGRNAYEYFRPPASRGERSVHGKEAGRRRVAVTTELGVSRAREG